jgi:hypothetical protein
LRKYSGEERFFVFKKCHNLEKSFIWAHNESIVYIVFWIFSCSVYSNSVEDRLSRIPLIGKNSSCCTYFYIIIRSRDSSLRFIRVNSIIYSNYLWTSICISCCWYIFWVWKKSYCREYQHNCDYRHEFYKCKSLLFIIVHTLRYVIG